MSGTELYGLPTQFRSSLPPAEKLTHDSPWGVDYPQNRVCMVILSALDAYLKVQVVSVNGLA